MAAKGNNLTQRRREMEVAEKVRLADVVDINTSSPPNYEGVKRYISTGAIVDGAIVESQVEMFGFSERPSRADLYPKEGDVLFAKMQATRKTFVVDRMNSGSLYSTGFYALTPHKDEIDTLYLSHYLDSEQFLSAKDKECNGATQKALSSVGFKKLLVPLPPLPAQRRIAAELDKICELKKNAETRLEKLDLLVKSRFVEMFGENQSWSKVGLLDVGECKNGVNFAPNERGYELHCIGVGNFKNFAEISNVESMPLVSLNARPSDDLLLRDGDILFVRSNGNKNLVGRCVVVHPRDTEVTFSGFCIRYRLASKRLDALYVVHYLRQSQVRRLLQGRGANIQNMSQRTLAGLSIPIPPLALQREFAAFVEKVDKLRLNIRSTVAKMDMLYRSKLQEYFG